MTEQKNPTCIRVNPGADNAQITDCTYTKPLESNRSFLETSAKNTQVTRAKIIELPKAIVEQIKTHKIFWFILIPLGVTIAGGVVVNWLK